MSAGDGQSQGTRAARIGNGAGHGGPASGIPARRWAPFEPGHTLTLKHGALSRFVLTEADELAATIAEHAPHLAHADAPALRDYALAQARAWRLGAWIEEHGELNEHGEPRPALRALREWLGRAEKARARLGLDPASRAGLAVDELQARRTYGAIARDELGEGRRLRLEAEARQDIEAAETAAAPADRSAAVQPERPEPPNPAANPTKER